MKKIMLSLCITILVLVSISCPAPGNLPEAPPTPDPQDQAPLTMSGCVRSAKTNALITGAVLFFQSAEAVTDSQGCFNLIIDDPTTGGQLRIKKQGFGHYQKTLSAITKSIPNMEIYLKPVDLSLEVQLDREGGNTLTTLDGASVSLPQITGEIEEPVIISLTSYNVSTEDIHAVPGDFTAIDDSGQEVRIVSQGMLDVTITGKESGQDYSLAGMGEYQIVIPISGDPTKATETIPMWYFDQALGKWVEEGVMRWVGESYGEAYTGTVTHFTTWNADYKLDDVTCITGTISDENPDKLYELTLVFPGFSQTFYVEDNDFNVINLPRGTSMALQVQNVRNNKIWFTTFTTNNSSACYNVGDFRDDSYVPEAGGLFAEVVDDSITVSWQTEPAVADHFEVTCTLYDGTPIVQNVVKGQMNEVFSNLEYGIYAVTIKTILADGRTSHGITKYVKISNNLMLSVSVENYYDEVDLQIYYAVNDNPDLILYERPALFPPYTRIRFIANLAVETGDFEYSFRWTVYDEEFSSQSIDIILFPANDEGHEGGDLDVNLTLYRSLPS